MISSNKLAHARSIGVALEKMTDELNASLERAEKAIFSLRLGVRAEVVIDEDLECPGYSDVLVYGKDGGVWGLFIIDRHDLSNKEWIPILKASKERRVKASEVLSELVDKLIDTAREQLTLMKERVDSIDELVKEFDQ